MSVYAMSWVWKHSRAAATDRLVLLAIADCANDRGEAWPSMAALVEKTALSERTVQRAVGTLVDLGELSASVGGGRGKTTKYRLIQPPDNETPSEKPRNPRPDTPTQQPRNADGESKKPRQPVKETPSSTTENPVTVTPGTIREPSREPSQEPSSSEPASRPDVEQICTHLADRVQANGSKRPAITDAWRKAARLLLDRDGRTVDQVIKAIDWCQDDDFWRGNVLSMAKLRDKYDQLRLAAQRGRASPNGHRAYRNPTDPKAYEEGL